MRRIAQVWVRSVTLKVSISKLGFEPMQEQGPGRKIKEQRRAGAGFVLQLSDGEAPQDAFSETK